MRVIAGQAKGHKVGGTSRKTTRAITDRIKESVFGILGDFSGKRVLDLFAGTGSIGIEALSRGAGETFFIDKDRECARLIKKNLSFLCISGTVYPLTARTGLKRLGQKGERFDMVFVDPPFKTELAEETLKQLDELNIVRSKGIVIARHHAKTILPEAAGKLFLKRREKYGDSIVCFYGRV